MNFSQYQRGPFIAKLDRNSHETVDIIENKQSPEFVVVVCLFWFFHHPFVLGGLGRENKMADKLKEAEEFENQEKASPWAADFE